MVRVARWLLRQRKRRLRPLTRRRSLELDKVITALEALR